MSLGVALIALATFACRQSSSAQSGVGQEANEITVSAASDLTPAFDELGRLFERETGVKVRFNFGSTGQLTQQIENGAPVDLFAAANARFIEDLERKDLILPDTKALYAQGRLTIWTRADSPLRIESVEDLARAEARKVAIANPEHAPYGAAAREALQSAGIWEATQPKLVFGENVVQTLQYAETGNVDAAIVALSISLRSAGRWILVPQEAHQPLNQTLAVIRGARREAEARRFAAFVNSPQGRAVMRKYGFILPGEQPVEAPEQ
jgi:molybdate transport system substrate-binding protein